ncbi:MAG: RNA methyltransferase [Thermodesulfobacteriota bacterium]|nr:RNA methyltransferase [Thermodesulfobacteriota bacterium]
MQAKIVLDSISIILVRPRFPENIGSVARAMKNMGIHRLIVVDGCSPLHMNAYKLASGAEEILERAEECPTLSEAISEMGCVVGTTSRTGKERTPLLTPEELATKLIPISKKNFIGLVFGSEKEGLKNEELSLCHLYTRIPSSESFPSLNLAQAVMVLCYELFQSSNLISRRHAPLASAEQMEKMFEHMERTLLDIGFLEAENMKRIMRTLRRLFGRSQMEERDVQILQGIWSRVDWILRRKKV